MAAATLEHWDELVSRYAGADTPRTPYFDRLQLEHTRQAHDYLLTHQGSRITLPELAAKFHLSQSSLKICFKALYGVPVASYLRGLRMDTAAGFCRRATCPWPRSRTASAMRTQPLCRGLPPPHRPPPHRAAAGGVPDGKQPHRVRFSCLPLRGGQGIFSKKIHSAHRMPFQSTPVVANRCRIMCKPYRFARWGTFYTPSQAYYSKGDLNYELGKDWSVCRRRSVWLRRY